MFPVWQVKFKMFFFSAYKNFYYKQICFRHLTKLFDSLACLKFVKGEDENSKHALGMFAKDGEYVEFNKDCDCSGAVQYIKIE